jgi:hypothetical protein
MTTKIQVQAHVGSQFSQVTVPIPTLKYLDNFVRHNRSGVDMLATGVFPNAKEITESFAAHHAVMHKLYSAEGLKRLNPWIVVVGDGATPRTGVTFAFKSTFNVISIDPNLKWENKFLVRRLMTVRYTLANFVDAVRDADFFSGFTNGEQPIILVNVHGHVPAAELKQFRELVGNRLFAVVEIPCCYPQWSIEAFGAPTMEYIDWGIHSEKRSVRIWKFRKEAKS